MRYVVYCDESRHEHATGDHYMAIGGLWVPRDDKQQLTTELRNVFRKNGLGGEVKWSKVSAAKLDAYKAVVDFFFERTELTFRTIVVEHSKIDATTYHGGDRELGFYKFYYEMLVKWLVSGNEYLVLLDFKMNKGAERYATLRTFLERKLRGQAWISDLTVIDSAQSPLAQLADLLTGAVAATWCGHRAGSPKEKLAAYVAERDGRSSLRVANGGPGLCKLNIFRIDLQ